MFKYWLAKYTYNISTSTIITALTIDHWYVSGAIIGILCTLCAMVNNILFSRNNDKRAEARLRELMSDR